MEYIKASAITTAMLTKQPKGIPLILCSSAPRAIRNLREAGYLDVSLNAKLSTSLVQHGANIRSSKVLPELQKIIAESGPAILLSDFEMLFDPRYKLDVLKVFCDLSRFTRIAVIWCGKCSGEMLEYAELGFPDYQRYEIDKYTVVCIK